MFEKKVISEIGYLQTSIPIRSFMELVEIINSNKLESGFNNRLAGQIEEEFRFDLNLMPPEIQKIILDGCQEYIKKFGHRKIKNRRNSNPNCNCKLIHCWLNFQKAGEYNPAHYHSGDLVFVLWVQIPYKLENEFKRPNTINSNEKIASCFQFLNVGNNFSSDNIHTIQVDQFHEGKMIIFPADMEHIVYPFFTSDDYRISMSGNLEIVFEE